MADLNLYPHQQTLFDEIVAAWDRKPRVLAWLPTGGGKTEIATAIAQREQANGGCTLFVVERKTLARQAAARFRKYGMLTGILRGDDSHVRGYEPVIVGSIQTMAARKDSAEVAYTLSRITTVIVDEAHIRFKEHDKLAKAMPDARILGLSATPLRDGLAEAFDVLVRGPDYDWMIEHRYLVRPRYFLPTQTQVDRALSSMDVTSTGDFHQGDLSKLMRDKVIVGDIVETWIEKASNRPTICFCVDIAHSRETCDAFRLRGIPSEHIDMNTKEDDRAAMFERFRTGQTKVLCSVVVLGTGFDEPSASCAILARPTLSLILHIQQIGRAMRPWPNKDDCLVLDHAGNVHRHGRVEDFIPPDLTEIDKRSDKKKRTQGPTDVFPCPECRALMQPGQRICDECGHEIRKPVTVHHVPGELVEDANARDPDTGVEDLQTLYRELLSYCDQRGRKRGWAYHKIKDNYGFKLPWAWQSLTPIPTSPRTLNLIKSWDIAYRKRQQKLRTASPAQAGDSGACRSCGSHQQKTGPGAGPHHASVRCARCDRFLRWLPTPPEMLGRRGYFAEHTA
jgi:DNA repair protein RadD